MNDLNPLPAVAIRTARPSDEASIMDICLRTADAGKDGTQCYSDPRLPGFVWALPYIRLCPDNAFVLTHGEQVMGYCVAAPDTVAFEECLKKEWWPMLRAELQGFSPGTPHDENVLAYIHNPPGTPSRIADLYPAHLHINVLPELQKGGHGSRLFSRQIQALTTSGVTGVHLGINPRNEGVVAFYRRFGLLEIGRTPSIIMAMRLNHTPACR
ncbi:ribosomal protein S18 acetylase RimI-like enzyme [Rhizobium aquaticum]|uniref:Ribosomal protein S18 acetylase RimI-like enzyme n=1 Tax=Rhizobium aquaticum TaxID=1549636 RepID=A0ABV2J0U3_9HYPH